jgi:predicted nucleic acid-binding protein
VGARTAAGAATSSEQGSSVAAMILVDTSTWIDHFRRTIPSLATALTEGDVGLHPFIMGELALGNVPRRSLTFALLNDLPHLVPSAHDEVLSFTEAHRLAGSGIGWVDAHLLCSAHRAGWAIWTKDRRVATAARQLGL